jgi:hypothetical protein
MNLRPLVIEGLPVVVLDPTPPALLAVTTPAPDDNALALLAAILGDGATSEPSPPSSLTLANLHRDVARRL